MKKILFIILIGVFIAFSNDSYAQKTIDDIKIEQAELKKQQKLEKKEAANSKAEVKQALKEQKIQNAENKAEVKRLKTLEKAQNNYDKALRKKQKAENDYVKQNLKLEKARQKGKSSEELAAMELDLKKKDVAVSEAESNAEKFRKELERNRNN